MCYGHDDNKYDDDDNDQFTAHRFQESDLAKTRSLKFLDQFIN